MGDDFDFPFVVVGRFEKDVGAVLGQNIDKFFRPLDHQEIAGVGPDFLDIEGLDFFDGIQTIEIEVIKGFDGVVITHRILSHN